MPEPDRQNHLYGGQALIEGVMMRGRDHWAVAVRRPDEQIYLESHDIDSVAKRHPTLAKPGLRGVIALGQAMSIGFRALTIATHQAQPEEEQLGKGGMALAMTLALTLFVGVFIVGPAWLFGWAEKAFLGTGLGANILEGIFRVMLLVGYVWAIGLMGEVRRVYQYHGAEHKTIAAYEHDSPLDPDRVDEYSTLHVRCGTNFLLIILIITILVFSAFPPLPMGWRIASRVIAIIPIAAVSYEMLRLGAKFHGSLVMRALMAPGLWLQKITTRPPDRDQIEIAISSFEEVLRCEGEGTDRPEGGLLGDPVAASERPGTEKSPERPSPASA
ncbi:MAG: DUF1385 domain-containing protein [Actinomycetota bacterium]